MGRRHFFVRRLFGDEENQRGSMGWIQRAALEDMHASTIEYVEEWNEYSIAVGFGRHDVTFVHVYNPFGVERLPRSSAVETAAEISYGKELDVIFNYRIAILGNRFLCPR